MEEQQITPPADGESSNDVKKVLDEDQNDVVDSSEIERIFRIYLGREATEEEMTRFEGIKESEWKVLQDYVDQERNMQKDKSSIISDGLKIQGDLENKKMKVSGEQAINNIPAGPMMEGANAPMPPIASNMPSGNMGNTPPTAQPAEGNNKYIRDGRYFLVNFK